MDKGNEFLGTEPIGKLLFRLSLPTIAAQVINMMYNLVDRIYIGHIPGEGDMALTGVGVAFPVIMIVSAFAALISMGGAPRASVCMGRGDNDGAEKYLGSGFCMQVIISAVLTAVMLIWNRSLLMVFGASPQTIGYAVDYLNIYAIGTVFVQLTLGMNSFITAQGFTKTGMFTVLIGAVSNIILDPVFIFGLKMGVRGAAVATIISQCFSMIFTLAFLCGKHTILKLRPENIRLRADYILPCLYLGVAPFIMQASESVLAICFNTSLLKYGGDIAVGAMVILMSVSQLAMLPIVGLGQGAQPITSYNYGAGNTERVKQSVTLLAKVCTAYSFLLWALVMIFPMMFARIFGVSPEFADFTARVMRIYNAMLLIFGMQSACQMSFIAVGNAKASIALAVMRKFVLLIPLIYIMPHIMTSAPTDAVYLAEPIADFLSVTFATTLFIIYFRKLLREMRMQEKAKAAKAEAGTV